jgi:hypothetical protein
MGCGVDVPPGGSAPCWRSRRTRPGVLWKPSPLSSVVRVVGPGLPGKALRPGGKRLVKRPGTALTCAMAVQVPWWLRPSKDV